MNENLETLERIFAQARLSGKCKTQKEFAELIGVHPSTMSLAMKGEPKYLTPKLLRMVTQWARLEGIDGEPAPAPKQEARPDIVIPAATIDLYTSMAKSIDRLTLLVERLQPGASAFSGAYGQKNYLTDGK